MAFSSLNDSSMFAQSAAEDFLVAMVKQELFQVQVTNQERLKKPKDNKKHEKHCAIIQKEMKSSLKKLKPYKEVKNIQCKTLKNCSSMQQESYVTTEEFCGIPNFSAQEHLKTQKQLNTSQELENSKKQFDIHQFPLEEVKESFQTPPPENFETSENLAHAFTSNHSGKCVSDGQVDSELFEKLLQTITNVEDLNTKNVLKKISDDLSNFTKVRLSQKSAINVLRKILKVDSELLIAVRNPLVTRLCKFLSANTKENSEVVALLTEIVALTPFFERLGVCEILQDTPKMLLSRRNEALSANILASCLWRLETRSAKKKEHMKFVVTPLLLMLQNKDEYMNFLTFDDDYAEMYTKIMKESKTTSLKLIGSSLNSIYEISKQNGLTTEEVNTFGDILVRLLQLIHEDSDKKSIMFSLTGCTKLSKKCFDILAIICKFTDCSNDCKWIFKLFTASVCLVCDPGTDITLLTKVLELLGHLDYLYSKDENNDLAFAIQKLLMTDGSWEKRDSAICFIDRLIRKGNDCSICWVRKQSLPRFLWERLMDTESYVRASSARSLSGLMTNEKIRDAFLYDCKLSKEDVLTELCKVVACDGSGFARRAAIESLAVLLTYEGGLQDILIRYNPESCEMFKRSYHKRTNENVISIAQFHKTDLNDIFSPDTTNSDSGTNHFDNSLTFIEGTNIPQSYQSRNINIWNFALMTVNMAVHDLDWEVKLKALEFWDILVNIIFSVFKNGQENKQMHISSENKHCKDVNQIDMFNGNIKTDHQTRLSCLTSALACLYKMGLWTLTASASDHDRLVALSCCKLLVRIRNMLQSNGMTFQNETLNVQIESCKDCHQCQTIFSKLGLGIKDLAHFELQEKLSDFVKQLFSTHVEELRNEKSLLINDYEQNPLLLFQDILAAAPRHDENDQLADCY